MLTNIYSYRLRRSVALLSRDEYAPIAEALRSRVQQIMAYRKEHGVGLDEARRCTSSNALALYESLTGIKLGHPEELYVVQQHIYGKLCPECQRPFRTPRAKMCAECGYALPKNEIAGPLSE